MFDLWNLVLEVQLIDSAEEVVFRASFAKKSNVKQWKPLLKNRQIAGIETNGNQEIHPNRHPMAPSGACAIKIQEVGILTKVRQFNQLTNTHDEATTQTRFNQNIPPKQIHLPKRLPVKKNWSLLRVLKKLVPWHVSFASCLRSEGNDGKETWNLFFLVLFQSCSKELSW